MAEPLNEYFFLRLPLGLFSIVFILISYSPGNIWKEAQHDVGEAEEEGHDPDEVAPAIRIESGVNGPGGIS